MLQPLDHDMVLMARPASLNLHRLNQEISNLQKIGQGAGDLMTAWASLAWAHGALTRQHQWRLQGRMQPRISLTAPH